MAKFFLRTNQKTGTANLYLRVSRPAMGISWWLCSGINVDVESWRKAEKSPKDMIKYLDTVQGKKVQELMSKVEGAIKLLFDQGEIKCNDDKEIIEKAILSVVSEDAAKALEEAEKRKREEEERRMSVIVNYYDYFLKGIKDIPGGQRNGVAVVWEISQRVHPRRYDFRPNQQKICRRFCCVSGAVRIDAEDNQQASFVFSSFVQCCCD